MKLKLPLFLLVFCMAACSTQDKTVYFPGSGEYDQYFRSLYKIEQADTATVIYMDMYNRPNYWCRISSDTYLKGNDTGKTYKLLSSPDFELDTEVFMPESGNILAILIFEPLDKEERSFDYIGGTAEDALRIENISLLPPVKKKYTCLIEGEVIDRPQSSRLVLAPKNTDIRVENFISIPVRDGKFSYTFTFDEMEEYELLFWEEYLNGSWYTTNFIAEPGTINFTFYPRDHEPRHTANTKAPLNAEYIRFKEETDSLFSYKGIYKESDALHEARLYYSKAFYALIDKLDDAGEEERRKIYAKMEEMGESGEALTEEAKNIEARIKETSKARKVHQIQYAGSNHTLVGYGILMNLIDGLQYEPDAQLQERYFKAFETVYRDKFPDHPYTEKTNIAIASMKIAIGGKYIDFTAPDLKGDPVKLSEQIGGKVALIDLWASWCGPCRRTSISMKPLYGEYKDKGFTIVGVAREKNDTKAMEKAIEQDGYAWLNLVELNDENKIWDLYGAGNAGGKTILVDRDGTILAVDTNAEEVRRILEEKCK